MSKSAWTSSKNPVSLRLYKVLGTNFADESTNDALITLSHIYGSANANPTEELNEESPQLTEKVPGETCVRARKNLRRDMETRLSQGSIHFLGVFGEVDEKLSALHRHVEEMKAACDVAEEKLRLSTETSKEVLERAGSLSAERAQITQAQTILAHFLKTFTLSADELELIKSSSGKIGKEYFAVMDKATKIIDDCQLLMGLSEGEGVTGTEILTTTTSHLSQAYRRLSSHLSDIFSAQGKDVHIEVSWVMREGITRLRQRPELLSETLSTLASIRAHTLLHTFLTALTRGNPATGTRPIELSASDGGRYVGDILAHIHQSLLSEREFLEGLFSLTDDEDDRDGARGRGRMVGDVRGRGRGRGRSSEEEQEEEGWIRQLMDRIFVKVGSVMRTRLLQTLTSQSSTISLYKLANLLEFYVELVSLSLGYQVPPKIGSLTSSSAYPKEKEKEREDENQDQGVVLGTLVEITYFAYTQFYDSLRTLGKNLDLSPPFFDTQKKTTPSLAPPLSLLEHAQIVKEVIQVYEGSILSTSSESKEEKSAGFAMPLNLLLDPALEVILSGSERKEGDNGRRWEREIWVVNCLEYLVNVLEPYPFASAKRAGLQSMVDEHVKILIEDHYTLILTDAGLFPILQTITTKPPSEPLAHIPATAPPQLMSALKSFSSYLSSPALLSPEASPYLPLLSSPSLAASIHREGLRRVCKAYERVCGEVLKGGNRYEVGRTMLGSERPFGRGEVLRSLLGLEGEESDSGEG